MTDGAISGNILVPYSEHVADLTAIATALHMLESCHSFSEHIQVAMEELKVAQSNIGALKEAIERYYSKEVGL